MSFSLAQNNFGYKIKSPSPPPPPPQYQIGGYGTAKICFVYIIFTFNFSRIVHGLYGTTLNDIFNQINNFTKYHPKEIVITDIKLVYTNKLKYETAIQLINKQVKTWFNSRAILAEQLKDYVIKEIWNKNISIIIFLHNNLSQKKTMEGGYRMEIKSPFDYNKFTQTSSWLHFLDLNYENRRLRHDKDSRSFYVTQGIMQPHWMEVVVAGISGSASLRVWVSEHATLKITHWLQGKKIGVGGINIVIGDFIESHHFVDSVLQLNIFSNVRQQGASQSKSIREASELKLKSVFYQLVAIFLIFRFFVNYS